MFVRALSAPLTSAPNSNEDDDHDHDIRTTKTKVLGWADVSYRRGPFAITDYSVGFVVGKVALAVVFLLVKTLPTCPLVTFRRSGTTRVSRQVRIDHTYGQLCTYIQRSTVEIQNPAHWKLIGRSMTACCLCYRPAVLFHHLRLAVISFPQGEMRRASQN